MSALADSHGGAAWRQSLLAGRTAAGVGSGAVALRTDPEGLDSRFKPYADAILKVLRRYDSSFVMTSGRRSLAKQTALYEAYIRGDAKLPVAVPGCSSHQYGLAADFARPGVDPKRDAILNFIGSAWQRAGGVWGGKNDPVHFSIPHSLPGQCT